MSTLPPSVSRRCAAYTDLLAREDAGFVRGIYLLGSLALGDWQDGRSDIDFAAFVDAPLDSARTDRLERVHRAMNRTNGPPFDGFYVEAHRLSTVPGPSVSTCYSLEGAFHSHAPCSEINPTIWTLWNRHAVDLRGPPRESLGIADDGAAVRAHQITNLKGYWNGWVAMAATEVAKRPPGESFAATSLAWGVLGVARIAYTLATGAIVSKSGGGAWALQTYGRRAEAPVTDALAARRGEIARVSRDQLDAALDFMRDVIAAHPLSCSDAPRLGPPA